MSHRSHACLHAQTYSRQLTPEKLRTMALSKVTSLIVGFLDLSPIDNWIRQLLHAWVWPEDKVLEELEKVKKILSNHSTDRTRLLSKADEGRACLHRQIENDILQGILCHFTPILLQLQLYSISVSDILITDLLTFYILIGTYLFSSLSSTQPVPYISRTTRRSHSGYKYFSSNNFFRPYSGYISASTSPSLLFLTFTFQIHSSF